MEYSGYCSIPLYLTKMWKKNFEHSKARPTAGEPPVPVRTAGSGSRWVAPTHAWGAVGRAVGGPAGQVVPHVQQGVGGRLRSVSDRRLSPRRRRRPLQAAAAAARRRRLLLLRGGAGEQAELGRAGAGWSRSGRGYRGRRRRRRRGGRAGRTRRLSRLLALAAPVLRLLQRQTDGTVRAAAALPVRDDLARGRTVRHAARLALLAGCHVVQDTLHGLAVWQNTLQHIHGRRLEHPNSHTSVAAS